MKKILLEIFYWTWCLPQTLLGLLLKLIFKGKKVWIQTPYPNVKRYHYYEYKNSSGSISLGKYILVCPQHASNSNVVKHEYGHQIQSLILGPLYLIVIGLPSLIWCSCFEKYREKHQVSYYDFYTEKWANKLGGVEEIA